MESNVYACEIYLNMALAQLDSCDAGGSMRSIVSAYECRSLEEHGIVEQILVAPCEVFIRLGSAALVMFIFVELEMGNLSALP